MKVILLKTVKKIGSIGDIREVTDGYAINFLFPQKIAQPASGQNINRLKKKQSEQVSRVNHDLVKAEKYVNRLHGVAIEIKAKANTEGRLYATITSSMIAKQLKNREFDIKSSQITLVEPIKEIGEHSVFINFNHGLEAEITVIVIEL